MGRQLLAVLAVSGLILFSAGETSAALPLGQPSWAELTPQQKHVLAPLADDWDNMDAARRKRWLNVAARYGKFTTEEQERLQKRMKDWAELTPDERKQAREKYKSLKSEPPEKRAEVRQKWEEYSGLSDDEKKRYQEAAKQQRTQHTTPRAPHPLTLKPAAVSPVAPLVAPPAPASATPPAQP